MNPAILRLIELFKNPSLMGNNNPMSMRTPPTFPTQPGSGAGGVIPEDFITQIPMTQLGSETGMTQIPPSQTNPEEETIEQLMQRLYTPEMGASNRFNEMVANAPQRQSGQGALRRIGAVALATLADRFGRGGGETAFEGVMYPGFQRKQANFKESIGPAYQAATLERGTNTNERQMAYQTAQSILRDRALDQSEQRAKFSQDIQQQKLELSQLRYSNPLLKFNFSGPTVMIMNPRTGQLTDTKIPTGNFTDAEKLKFNQDFQRSMQEDRQDFQAGQQEDAQQFRVDNPTTSGSGRGALLPTQERTRRANTADMLMQDPRYKPYIKLNQNGDPEIKGNPSPAMREFLQKQIFGDIPQFQETNVPPSIEWNRGNSSNMSVVPPPVNRIPSMGPNATPSPQLPGTGGRPSGSPPLPQSLGPGVLSKQQRHKVTKEIITVYSYDGGRTWGPPK